MPGKLRSLAWPLAVGAVIALLGYGCGIERLGTSHREDVLAEVLPSAVQIVLEHPEGRRFRTGSGVVIAARPITSGPADRVDCFVLTSGHTMAGTAGEKAIYLLFGRHRGAGTKVGAVVVAHRETAEVDVALLRAESPECVPARPAPAPTLGEPIWVITFPWGRNLVLAGGIVSQQTANDAPDRE
jgi:S1-C subfamily serine protease